METELRRIVSLESSCPGPASDVVRLDHDGRTRRRIVYATESGASILLEMPRPVRLRDGDGLRLEDGSLVRVIAMAEPLIEITAPDHAALVRIAWHLGNRHLPTQLMPGPEGGSLRIRHDHVIAEMVERLGGLCSNLMAAFEPEGGAYEGAGHGRAQAREHGHAHG